MRIDNPDAEKRKQSTRNRKQDKTWDGSTLRRNNYRSTGLRKLTSEAISRARLRPSKQIDSANNEECV